MSQDYFLPNDVCRCHDGGCPEREECLRWLCKDSGGIVGYAESLFPYDIPLNSQCPCRISIEEGI